MFLLHFHHHLKTQKLIMIRVRDVSVAVDSPRLVVQVTHRLEQFPLNPTLIC